MRQTLEITTLSIDRFSTHPFNAPQNLSKGIRSLRPICEQLRYGFIALLAVALLAGPCRSVVGAFGFSPAHAHVGMNQVLPHGMVSSHDHDSAGQSFHQLHGKAPDNSRHPAPLSCEDLCEGWAVKKAQRLWAMPVSDDFDDLPLVPRLVSLKFEFLPDLRRWRNQPEPVSRAGHPRSQAAYQLTGRYRL